ncbi:M90 family metallopeptidase [Arcticibacter eurypsychrophilus]|uniref:M90 family metallopeptidase n=1 Tax=Arcticibacter eurypsychrophilus TaxID=1434752 RepID=UPI00084E05BF|nr:M90 family metallopeptidase [Arcticibacter eurypsychrophilus]
MAIIFSLLFLLAIVAFFIFRKKALAEAPELPTANYKDLLAEHVAYFQKLDQSGQASFETMVQEFLKAVRIEGVGTEITDLDRTLIASSAVIPIFGFKEWRYKNLTNVILYPDTFNGEFQFEGESRNIMGMVGSGYMNGQMLLSREALIRGFSKSSGKENAAIHEFVHLLDKADGSTDGVPEQLMTYDYALPWLKMMHQEMHHIETGKSDINPYALTNEAEFLAVAAEYFFEKPDRLQDKHPDLYQRLSEMFAQKLVIAT